MTRPKAASDGREGKAAPARKGKAAVTETLPLLSALEAEDWLAERLKQHGHDIYAGGQYATYADRLGACIVRNGIACVIVGRNQEGKAETYSQLFERLYGRPLPTLSSETNTAR